MFINLYTFLLTKHGAIIIGIEGVAMIRHYLFTRARSLTQTFIIIYTVIKLLSQNLN